MAVNWGGVVNVGHTTGAKHSQISPDGESDISGPASIAYMIADQLPPMLNI